MSPYGFIPSRVNGCTFTVTIRVVSSTFRACSFTFTFRSELFRNLFQVHMIIPTDDITVAAEEVRRLGFITISLIETPHTKAVISPFDAEGGEAHCALREHHLQFRKPFENLRDDKVRQHCRAACRTGHCAKRRGDGRGVTLIRFEFHRWHDARVEADRNTKLGAGAPDHVVTRIVNMRYALAHLIRNAGENDPLMSSPDRSANLCLHRGEG